jgi:anti-sigma factor RsiW
MTGAPVDDSVLQQFFDGELPSEEATAVERALHSDAALRTRYDQLVRLQALLRMEAEKALDEVSFEGLYARIQAGAQAENAPDGPGGLPRLWGWCRARVREMLEGGTPLWMPAAGTAAVAAAVLLMIYSPQREPVEESSVAPSQGGQAPAGPGADSSLRASRHSEVVAVDFGSGTGTVFEIDLAEGGSTPVVWINDG